MKFDIEIDAPYTPSLTVNRKYVDKKITMFFVLQ